MALIVVLSVFNGFETLILSLVNSFNPDLKVSVKEGKVFHMDELPVDEIENIPGIVHYSKVVEDNALFRYENQQHVGIIKGVDSAFQEMTPLDTMLMEGNFVLEKGRRDYAILGQGVAYYLGINLTDPATPVSVYTPRRDAKPGGINPMSAFIRTNVYPSGVFGIQAEIDENYMIVPLEVARKLYQYSDEVSALEIDLSQGANPKEVAGQLKTVLGDNFQVKTRLQQQATLYKILGSEKWVTFLILSFILVIATFNVIGSLSLIILDKKKDIAILYSMGATGKFIKRIFLYEGMLVTFIGAASGLLLGGLIIFLQEQFGLVGFGSSNSFIISAYPVDAQLPDFLIVFGVVMLIGWLTSLFPVRQISKRFLDARSEINPE
jgi:lipoprotein-releasing system permease protein